MQGTELSGQYQLSTLGEHERAPSHPHWGDDRDTSDVALAHHGAGSGLRRRIRVGGLPAAGSCGRVRLRAADAGGVRLPPARPRRQGYVLAHIGKTCGFSAAQISRLIRQQAETGAVVDRRARNSGRPFEAVYAAADIRLLAKVDMALGGISGLAPCEILRRTRDVHGDACFERLADMSRSHEAALQRQRPRRRQEPPHGAQISGPRSHPVRVARESLSPFLNFHRPRLFATERMDAKGRGAAKCRRDDVLTPLPAPPASLRKAQASPTSRPFGLCSLDRRVRMDKPRRSTQPIAAESDVKSPVHTGETRTRTRMVSPGSLAMRARCVSPA